MFLISSKSTLFRITKECFLPLKDEIGRSKWILISSNKLTEAKQWHVGTYMTTFKTTLVGSSTNRSDAQLLSQSCKNTRDIVLIFNMNILT